MRPRSMRPVVVMVPLTEDHGAMQPTAEARLIVAETIALLARSTTPLRWRTFRSWAFGVSVHEIARRDRAPVATVYNRLRLARRDFRAALARLR